jgi:hypothetical protein
MMMGTWRQCKKENRTRAAVADLELTMSVTLCH